MLAVGPAQLMLIVFVTFPVSFVFSDYYLLKRKRFINRVESKYFALKTDLKYKIPTLPLKNEPFTKS